ncbi:MAG: hypothetical protein WD423_06095 [Rhodothermales bacterium]
MLLTASSPSFLGTSTAAAQSAGAIDAALDAPSSRKALALSLVVPGLGHRYVHGGDWDAWGSVFAVADAGLWAGLLGTIRHRAHLVQSYQTLAATHAGVEGTDRSRDFYLNVARYRSSDEYLDAQLRSRSWDQLEPSTDPSFEWEWDSEAHFHLFRDTRETSESLRRRRTFIITTLVANRLVAGITAFRAARRAEPESFRLSFGAPPRGAAAPMVRLDVTL